MRNNQQGSLRSCAHLKVYLLIEKGDCHEICHNDYCCNLNSIVDMWECPATLIALWTCGNVQAEAPDVQFREPTPDDGATLTQPTVQVEATIGELDHPELLPDLTEVTFQWDGVDYALYDSSLVLMFNFNNVYELGEDYQNQPGLGVRDLSLSGNDGYLGKFGSDPLTGVPSWTESAIFGAAFDFSASNSESILVAHDPSLNPGDGDFAILLWILPEQNEDSDIIRKGSTLTSDGMWYKLEHSAGSNNKISLNFNTNGTDATIFSSDSYADDNWHFVLAQRKGDQAELWIDGVQDGTVAVTGEIYNDANMAIGSKDTQDDDFFNGMITEVRMYMKSFSPDEVELLYDSMLGIYPAEPTKWLLEAKRNGLESGDYIYSVSATNASDPPETYTNERTVTVALPAPPDVTLVSPANGSILNNPTVTFTVDAADPVGLFDATLYIGTPEQVATFSGSAETDDAQISADAPDTTYGSASSINVDGGNPHAHAVIKFPNLIGNGVGQVPLDTTVVSATLQVNCTNLGAMMQVYRLTGDWAENTVTWNDPWTNPGGDYDPAIVVNGDCTATGLRTIDITEFVQTWSDGTPNYGILLTDTGADGVDFDSSESGNPPMLTVVYAGDWQAVDTQTMSGTSGTATFTDVALQDMTDYVWNCLVTNATDTPISSWAPENFNLSIDGQTPDEPVLVAPTDGATGVPIPATLEVTVSDPQTEDTLDVTFYGRKKTSTEAEFTIVALPDTQKYVVNGTYSHIFMNQIQWIIDNKDTLNIVFVTHEGDIVDTWNSTTQWEDVNECISLLDGIVPYSVVPGDHDHYGEDPPGSTEYYEQCFPASRFADALIYPYWGGSYAGNYGGDYNEIYPHTNNSDYQLLTIGGEDYIFVSLDFCPSQDEIDWANGVLTTYSERKAILTTHALLDTNANYYGSGDFWLYPDGSSNSSGDTSLIWYDLIRNHENLQLVLCGHMHGESRRTDDNLFGKPVHQLMANYQSRSNGGNGWLRIMRFVPAENKIYVQTYSPSLDQYETDTDSQFELDMPMSLFTEIGTNLDVANGSNTSVAWTDLAGETEYEWYVTVTDSTDRTSVGPDWSFTTVADLENPIITSATGNTVGTTSDSVAIQATITDNADVASATVYYTPIGGVETSVPMTEGGGDVWSALVPVAIDKVGDITYYITAQDPAGNSARDPLATGTYTITITDNDAPTISGATGDVSVTTQDTVPISATITDNIDVIGATLHYTPVGGGETTIAMAEGTDNLWSGSIPTGSLEGAIPYYITAEDAVPNTATNPPTGSYTITVNAPGPTTLFSDGFESGNLTTGGWTSSGSVVIKEPAAYEGVYGVQIGGIASIAKSVSTAGFADIRVKYARKTKGLRSGESLTVEWSADGTAWNVIESTSDTAWGQRDIALGAEAGENAAFSVRFRTNAIRTNRYGSVDSVEITGTTAGPVNNPPVANDDADSTNEDTGVTILVLANDTDADAGDTLSVQSAINGSNGSVVNNGDSVTYTPNANFNGTDVFTYTVSDGKDGTDTGNVTVTVLAVNDPPSAGDDSAATNEDTAVVVDVLANDSDIDGDTLSVESVGAASSGNVANNGNSVTYTPNPGFVGSDSFTYTVADGKGGTDTATVSITVTEFNNPPVANDDTDSTNEDTDVTILVLANDTDADPGDTLSVQSATNGSNGSVVNNGDSVTYTPNANFNGTDVFTYTVSDGKGGTDTGSVTVTVLAVNDPPSAGDDSAATDEDTAVVVDVLANDSDIDGDTLSVESATNGSNGIVVVNGDNTVTYTPDAAYNGDDSFTYTISDGKGGTDTATVTITVNPAGSIVYVASIDMLDFVSAGRNSKAVAGITLNAPEAGATVLGDWYFNGEVIQTGASGTTDAGGYTEIVSVPVKAKSGGVFRFVITDVGLSGYTYDSNQGVTENSITFP